MPPKGGFFMSQPLATNLPHFQWFPKPSGESVRHGCDKAQKCAGRCLLPIIIRITFSQQHGQHRQSCRAESYVGAHSRSRMRLVFGSVNDGVALSILINKMERRFRPCGADHKSLNFDS